MNELMEEREMYTESPTKNAKKTDEEMIKAFRNHMLRGNVNAALRLLNKSNNKGILPINEETIKQLHDKYPVGEPAHEEMLLNGPMRHVHPVVFDNINGELVQKVAMKMKGAADLPVLTLTTGKLSLFPDSLVQAAGTYATR